MEPIEAQYAASPALEAAYDNLRKAIEELEKIQGGQIWLILNTKEGLMISAALSPESFESFEYSAGIKARN